MEIKFLSSTGLSKFLQRLYEVFSQVGHTHTKSQITDFPTVPTKVSQLTNDKGFITEEDLPKRFYVTVNDDGTTSDKTYSDILAAYIEEKEIVCLYQGLCVPLAGITEEIAVFSAVIDRTEQTIIIGTNYLDIINNEYVMTEEIPTTLPNPNSLKINGVSYDGSNAVEITNLVTEDCVDTKLTTILTQAKESGEFNGNDGKSAYEYAQDAGYEGSEEEFSNKLAMGPLVGTTTEITPLQIAEAIAAGREISLLYTDPDFGNFTFSSFTLSDAFNVVVSTDIVQFNGMYILLELLGSLSSGDWIIFSPQIATINDIPTKTSELTNDSGFLTSTPVTSVNGKIGEVTIDIPVALKNPHKLIINGTAYDGSEAVNMEVGKKENSIFYIVGNSTTAGVWTGTSDEVTEYFDGLTILYKTNVEGISGGTTLDINNLGAMHVKRNASTAITTTYPVGSVIMFTYSTTDGVGYWLTADYDANTKTTTGASNKIATKLYLTGASSQTSSGTTTYSNENCYIGTDNRLYSNGEVVPNISDITALITEQLSNFTNAEEVAF